MLGLCSTFVVISCEHFGQIIRTGSLPSRGWVSGEHLLILTCLNSDIVDDSRFSNAVDRYVKFKLGRQFDEIFFNSGNGTLIILFLLLFQMSLFQVERVTDVKKMPK